MGIIRERKKKKRKSHNDICFIFLVGFRREKSKVDFQGR